MLKETERQKPGEYWTKKRYQNRTVTPSLQDLGLDKKTSSLKKVPSNRLDGSWEIEALRQLGNMLKETERNEGGRPLKTSTKKEPVFIPTLSDLGLDKKTSSLARKIAIRPYS